MPYDKRKLDILNAIIKDYISTGEPVGSRTIEKKYSLGVSSATIRNEMSDLEEMGYLLSPHTSAGRIPSQKAYRLYVDEFLKAQQPDSKTRLKAQSVYESVGTFYQAIDKTVEALSSLTNLTAVGTSPHLSELNIRDVKLIPIEGARVLIVLITKQGIVSTSEIMLTKQVKELELERVGAFLSNCIKDMDTGFTVASFTGGISALEENEQQILSDVLLAIRQILNELGSERIYFSGATKMLGNPEFSDLEKAKNFLEMLDKRELLSYLLYDLPEAGINIKIGDENELSELSECSMLTSTYSFFDKPVGTLGLIGPMRMDYDYAVSVMHLMSGLLSGYFKDMLGEKR